MPHQWCSRFAASLIFQTCRCPLLLFSSGAIQIAKLAQSAEKRSNLRAVKIRIARIKSSDDRLELSGKGISFFASRPDSFRSSPYVSGSPMLRIVNFAIPERLYSPERDGRNPAGNARQPAFPGVAPTALTRDDR